MGLFREKNAGVFEKYAYGFLSLLLLSFAVSLVAVKFSISFEKYSLLILLVWGFALLTGMISCLSRMKSKKRLKSLGKYELWYLIPAVLLFAYSYLYLAPSFANDDTWEVVATTVNTGTIFEYSAMTGEKIVNGFPIFNKMYFLPLLYSVFVDTFKIPMNLLGGVLLPFMVFITNLGLIKRIGEKVGISNVPAYMLLYMLALIGGTYLPSNGITATFGYGILREAYSGYGIFYGVVVPFMTLLILEKKWLKAAYAVLVSAGLLRLDRIFFALKTPVSTWNVINSEGKMVIFTLISVAAAFFVQAVSKTSIEWKLVFCPPAFFSYMTGKVQGRISNEKYQRIFLCCVGIFVITACNFEPFKDSQTFISYLRYEKEVAKKLSELESEDCCILAPVEFMAATRRLGSNVRTLFGRDDVSTYMAGLDYEDTSEYVTYYYRYTLNHYLLWKPYYIPYTEDELLGYAKEEGMDYLIFP